MPCVYRTEESKCSVLKRDTPSYGLTENTICQGHFDEIAALLGTVGPMAWDGKRQNPQPDLLVEYTMLKVLMQDLDTCHKHLGVFSERMNANDKDRPNQMPTPRLTAVLEQYEALCWFPETRLVPVGLIKKDFEFLIRCGYQLKDPGAGRSHGQYTHRLQWHIVSSVITQGFTRAMGGRWKHSPLELYCKLGDPEFRIPIGNSTSLGGHSTNVWGYIFDQGSGTNIRYSHPDNLHGFLCGEGQATHGTLSTALRVERSKRDEEFREFEHEREAFNELQFSVMVAEKDFTHAGYFNRGSRQRQLNAAKETLTRTFPNIQKPEQILEERYRHRKLGDPMYSPIEGPERRIGRIRFESRDYDYGDALLIRTGHELVSEEQSKASIAASRRSLRHGVNVVR